MTADPRHAYTSSDKVRCPHCAKEIKVESYEHGPLWEEGCHVVSCHDCDADIPMRTMVRWTFVCPPVTSAGTE